ncbi:armadillo-type protein [Mycena galericulata]|nr:armadillo-type protein [Mycena galericulata]
MLQPPIPDADNAGLAPDVLHAIALINTAYSPSSSLDEVQAAQAALLAVQRTRGAWGLVVPLLSYSSASSGGEVNVQFFGAHTAHAKIARGDLGELSAGEQVGLRDALVGMAGVPGRARVVRRKVYGAVVALAVRMVGGSSGSGGWDGWIEGTVQALVQAGAPSGHVHEFLAGAAEDIGAANLLPQHRIQLTESLRAAAPLVLQSIAAVLGNNDASALPSALACLAAWLPSGVLPAQDVARLVPPLIALLDSQDSAISASTALSELLARPPAAWAARPAVLLEPLFLWVYRAFPLPDTDYTYAALPPRELRRHARLLVALSEAGVEWVAGCVVDESGVAYATEMQAQVTRGALARHFLRVMLALTAADRGGAPVSSAGPVVDADDEEEGEEEDQEAGAALGFWYLLQEALWEVPSPAHQARAAHARAAYAALVRILRGKVVCGRGRGWGRDRLERFAVYRRDVADTLVNAYYILRDDLLAFYVADVAARLDARAGWEDIEATLHCLRAVHEALDPDAAGANPALARLFGAGVFGRLPVGYGAEEYRGGMGVPGGGHGGGMGLGLGEEREREEREAIARVRRTALGLVDTYSAYFTTQPPEALGAPLRYVLGALADPEPGVCLQGALALRSLCDANRRALAGQIGAFAEVHAGIGGVPDSEKGKVLQSIASVIQALPPAEGVGPVEALVRPVLQRLAEALGAAGAHPEPARLAAILQLEILAGIARGLTRTADPLAFDEDDGGGEEGEVVRVAREDPRSGGLRNGLFEAIAQVAELWSADSEVGQALSELFRAITALPADVTLLSLPAQPLLSVVCRAAGRRLTAVWLALATILIAQLNPPPMILTLQSAPSPEAEAGVRGAVGEIVGAALTVLGAPGGMVENPDIVQEFFACMDRVAQDFTGAFCALPDGAFDALMQCAISALALQERYSLVAACTFLGTLIHRTALYAAISPEILQQLQAHMIRVHGRAIMRAVLCGFAGAAPRSVTSNLLELLGALGGRGTHVGGGARGWVPGVVFADDFFPSKAGQDAKERFVKTVVSSRSVKKTKEAANQFAIVAWGLEGSTFGYSSA